MESKKIASHPESILSRARKKYTKEFRVASPLMGEGEDEGESPRLNMPWYVDSIH